MQPKSPSIFSRKLVLLSLIGGIVGFVGGLVILYATLFNTYSLAGSSSFTDKPAVTNADAKLKRNEKLVYLGEAIGGLGAVSFLVFAGSAIYYGQPGRAKY